MTVRPQSWHAWPFRLKTTQHRSHMVAVAFDRCLQNTAFGVVERRDGSDDDGGAVPTVHAAPNPDDLEPEMWREWSLDFRMATASQNATVFEILNWIEKNGEHTFWEIMATDPEEIRDGRFNGMETIDKEIFQHRCSTQRRRQRWLRRQWRAQTCSQPIQGCTPSAPGELWRESCGSTRSVCSRVG